MASVLNGSRNPELHRGIARLSVLFEDLRIEVAGMAAEQLTDLDHAEKKGRELYFLRRSMGTLHEFAEALEDIDVLPEFRHIRQSFDPLMFRLWNRSIAYFRRHKGEIARVRHHVGGHFGEQAAGHAVSSFNPDAIGWLEIAFYQGGGGATLGFASEIAATALVKNVRGRDNEHRVRRLIRMAIVGYRHAVRAVDCITATYLWERFGKPN